MSSLSVSGIYQIRNLLNQKLYIGSSVNITRRWNSHRLALCTQTHHNRLLRRAWKKYGENAFVFEILETVIDHSQLIVREQYYLDTRPHEELYNLRFVAEGPRGCTLSLAHRRKIGHALRGRKRAPIVGQRIREALLGHSFSLERRKAVARGRQKQSLLTWVKVRSIRTLRKKGVSLKDLQNYFGISCSHLSGIIHNHFWVDPQYTPPKKRLYIREHSS